MEGNVTVRELSSGHLMIFDEGSRDLFLIESEAAGELKDTRTPDAARELAQRGRARHFTREDLQIITDALANIVLLG